jgi:cytoskeleton protein RodZ
MLLRPNMLPTNEECLMSETEMPMNAEPSKSKLDAPGVQLKAQREALGWSIEHVAEQIKLAPRQVVAIEENDTASLPNMAVVRGFIRAYAKVVKLDAAPLVAMIEVHSLAGHDTQEQAPRREGSTTFAEVRFPSMTQRALISRSRFIVAVLLLLFLLLGAYKMGVFASLIAMTQTSAPAAVAAQAGNALPPVQSKAVPLISIPVQAGTAPRAAELPVAGVSLPVATATAAPAAAAAPAATAAVAAAAQSSNALVLTVTEDSWIELRSSGIAPQISRIVRAGNTETFDITRAVTLVIGNVGGVSATLRGAPLALTSAAGSTISRLALE